MNTSYSKKTGGFNWQNFLIFLAIWLLLSFFFRGIYSAPEPTQLPYTDFKQSVSRHEIKEISIQGNTIEGEISSKVDKKTSEKEERGEKARTEKQYFITRVPEFGDPELLGLLESNDVIVNVKSSEQPWFIDLIVGLLPWIFIIGIFLYTAKKMRERFGGAGGGGPFSFGKSKAKLYKKSKSSVTFDHVAGLPNAKKELKEIIAFLKNPEKF